MTHIIKTINGEEYRIDEKARNVIAKMLTSRKEDRPAFVEIASIGAIIATASITCVVRDTARQTSGRLPTPEEELAEFNREWDRGKPC